MGGPLRDTGSRRDVKFLEIFNFRKKTQVFSGFFFGGEMDIFGKIGEKMLHSHFFLFQIESHFVT